jgi:Domain of unknown function (DUF4382)
MMTIRQIAATCVALIVGIVAGCGGGDGISGTGSAAGSLRVSLTDAPSCGYDEVNVTVQKVRVHQSATALDSDSGWVDIVLLPTAKRRIDLLTLSNGVLEELGQTALPAGRYTQLRLVLAANGNSAPWANSVWPTGGAETALDTPSAQQSGIKLNVDIDVPADKLVDVVLDFDACKSIVKRGNSGHYNLKPVISVIPRLFDAGMRIVGYVDPTLPAADTEVSAQLAGVPVKSTRPDATGKFELYPVPAGTYDLVVSAAGRVTTVMTGVPVITAAHTNVNTASLRIVPPLLTAPLRQVDGTVTPATGTVRALQQLTGIAGPTVEVAWGSVAADTGIFQFKLPLDAPVKTAYVANPVTLVFTADAAAAGHYTLEAASNGARKTSVIDANAVVAPIDFVFP